MATQRLIGTPFDAPRCATCYDVVPSVSPGGTYLVANPYAIAAAPDGTVTGNTAAVWTIATHQIVSAVGTANYVAFSPDGHAMAVAARQDKQHTIHVVNPPSGQVIQSLIGATAEVHGLSYSSDGLLLASIDTSGKVVVWDVASGKVLEQFQRTRSESRLTARFAFQPSLHRHLLMVVGGPTVTLRDATNKQLYVHPFTVPGGLKTRPSVPTGS